MPEGAEIGIPKDLPVVLIKEVRAWLSKKTI